MRRVRFVKHAQRCGFTLGEIRELLSLRTSPEACCKDVRARAVEKKLQVEAKIKALEDMSRALDFLIENCVSGDRPLDECAILSTLEGTATAHADARD